MLNVGATRKKKPLKITLKYSMFQKNYSHSPHNNENILEIKVFGPCGVHLQKLFT